MGEKYLDMIKAIDNKEKEISNDEYLIEYIKKELNNLHAEEDDDNREKINVLEKYLSIRGESVNLVADNGEDTERALSHLNEMTSYLGRYNEKHDSKFIDKVAEVLFADTVNRVGFDKNYPAEFIRALADVSLLPNGKTKLIGALRVMMYKSKDVLPLAAHCYAENVCILADMIDSLYKYGVENDIIENKLDDE